jgi:hypothetical protein
VDPGEDGLDEAFGVIVAGEEAGEDHPAEHAGHEERTRGDELGGKIADHAVAEAGDDCGQQRQEDDCLDH